MDELRLAIGPARFRLLSSWQEPLAQMGALYAAYPQPDFVDFTVRIEPTRPWRKWLRPKVALKGDFMLPDAAPLPLAQAILGLEMAMNLQMALGWRRHLLLHASAVEKNGRVLLMTGESGSGKSTMAAMLGEKGWRFLSDEFALVGLDDGSVAPFPRLVSLKNEAIAAMEAIAPDERFGPRLVGTPKGDIRHLVPPADAVAKMTEAAPPALLLYPRFGHDREIRPVGKDENFVRLTQASTNYVALGEAGFGALTWLVNDVPAYAIDYGTADEAMAMIDELWAVQS